MQINGAFGHKIFNGTGLAYTNMSIFPDYNVLKGAPEKILLIRMFQTIGWKR